MTLQFPWWMGCRQCANVVDDVANVVDRWLAAQSRMTGSVTCVFVWLWVGVHVCTVTVGPFRDPCVLCGCGSMRMCWSQKQRRKLQVRCPSNRCHAVGLLGYRYESLERRKWLFHAMTVSR